MIESRKREHSRKPDEQYEFIERCSPGPYLEMFARHAREGWSAWGDESADDVAPRGQVHRGYAGGPIEVPRLESHARMTEGQVDVVGTELRHRYESGASIRAIAESTGYSIQRVRTLLLTSGAVLRGRGGSH